MPELVEEPVVQGMTPAEPTTFADYLNGPEGARAAAGLNAFVRQRVREENFVRRILPPAPLPTRRLEDLTEEERQHFYQHGWSLPEFVGTEFEIEEVVVWSDTEDDYELLNPVLPERTRCLS